MRTPRWEPIVNKPFNREKEKAVPNSGHFVNEQIRAERIIVIDDQGVNLGPLPRFQALQRALDSGVDLVQVGDSEGVPIAKLMDFGKFLYTKKKQQHEAKKHQKIIVVKELKMRPNIGDQDYRTKLNQAIGFFADGDKVKFTLQFRGREITMMSEVGPRMFQRITTDLTASEVGQLVEEKDTRSHALWTKIFYVKGK